MTPERIRTTISLTPETLAIFKRMADASNMSVSRCMGDWLVDTVDAAEMITTKMEQAREAPMLVLREMRSLLKGMDTALIEDQEAVRQRRAEGRHGTGRSAGAPQPPSGNTGVLVPPTPMTKSNPANPSQRKKV